MQYILKQKGRLIMHLQEITKQSELAYQAKIFHVTKDVAELENGSLVERDVVHHSGGVCVVPLTEQNTILMVQQYRYPFHEVTLEIPAGKREKGEDPETCGRRELREEVGRTCEQYTPLGCLYPTPAYDTEVIYMYLARSLSAPMQQHLDEGEFLDIIELPLEAVVNMVMDGKIPDAKTQLAILKTWVYLQQEAKK
jgi:ADP-ribose pyrophosphatase